MLFLFLTCKYRYFSWNRQIIRSFLAHFFVLFTVLFTDAFHGCLQKRETAISHRRQSLFLVKTFSIKPYKSAAAAVFADDLHPYKQSTWGRSRSSYDDYLHILYHNAIKVVVHKVLLSSNGKSVPPYIKEVQTPHIPLRSATTSISYDEACTYVPASNRYGICFVPFSCCSSSGNLSK